MNVKENYMINEITKESSVRVTVRIRPFTKAEENKLVKYNGRMVFLGDGSFISTQNQKNERSKSEIRKIIDVVDSKMLIFDPPNENNISRMQKNIFYNNFCSSKIKEHKFVFDRLFDENSTQEDVYNGTTKSLIDCVLEGYNATVFAYGATGCGKTHTILGSSTDPGIVFLTMKELYDKIENLKDTKIIDLTISYLEIYNETIRDLLNPVIDHKKLIIREEFDDKITVSNLLVHNPRTVEDVMNLIAMGNKNRTSSSTEANATSSRSHAVLQINIVQKSRTASLKEEHTYATLLIIDLAGSERAASTKNRGVRLNEGANINKSLLALGNCINALCDFKKKNHVPYRNSKLTRLLKYSLGGNCKTVMIVCVSPLSRHYDETLNTLKYANRAKEIKTKNIKNKQTLDRHVSSYLKMINEQKLEIQELRSREKNLNDLTTKKHNEINKRCLLRLFDSIDKIKNILDQSQEKWKRYFLLAKRKILILQKIDSEAFIDKFLKSLSDFKDHEEVKTLINLFDQLFQKINTQITEIEYQYSNSQEVDHIFNVVVNQKLLDLKEIEGWCEIYTYSFEKNINFLKQSFERDILFNSSILFDHLTIELKNFNYIPNNFGEILNHFINLKKINDNNCDLMFFLKTLIVSIEKLINGEFDLLIANHTTFFMQNKFEKQQVENHTKKDYISDSNLLQRDSSIHNKESDLTDKKSFFNYDNKDENDSKKKLHLSLKISSPNSYKKTITKNFKSMKFSPTYKQKKRFKWNMTKELSLNESDLSIDDSLINNNNVSKNESFQSVNHYDFNISNDDSLLNIYSNVLQKNISNNPNIETINETNLKNVTSKKKTFVNPRLSIKLNNNKSSINDYILKPILNNNKTNTNIIDNNSI